jgi:hypothetical protein
LATTPDPSYLGLATTHDCHTQGAWVRYPFPALSFLGLKGDVKSKLTTTTTTIIDFTFQIKYIYFFLDNNNIYFKFNNINKYNNINNNIKLVWPKFL